MTDDLEQRVTRDLHRVAAATPVPPLPTAEQPVARRSVRGRRRRVLIAAAAVTTGLVIAVPVAAAAGGLSAIRVAFGWTHDPPTRGGLPVIAANDATGRYLLTVPGPPGTAIQIWTADAIGGGQCVSLLEPVHGGYLSRGTSCSAASTTQPTLEFEGGGGDTPGWIGTLDAPGAAYVTLADGLTTRKIPVADGISAYWLPPVDQGRAITLTSYDTDGAVIDTTTGMHPYVAFPPPGTPASGNTSPFPP